jgi:hypothetical protein
MKEKSVEIVKKKYDCLKGFLNERSRRIWAATEAEALGWGGMTIVSEATGMDCHTIRKGRDELERKQIRDIGHIRRKGGGRKKITEKYPEILKVMEEIAGSSSRDIPEISPARTCRSSYDIAEELKNRGYDISQKSVYTILTEELGYNLISDRKPGNRKKTSA